MCAGGRKEGGRGVVEGHHYCRGLDTTNHELVVAVHATDGNGTGVFFVLIKKKKKKGKKIVS